MPLPHTLVPSWDTVASTLGRTRRRPITTHEHVHPGLDHPDAIAHAREARPRNEDGIAGHVVVHRDFPSEVLGNTRDLWVYLPPDYDRSGDRRYPTLYMHDGQNLFSPSAAFGGEEWAIDETAEHLIGEGQVTPFIVVGVANTEHRSAEYTWVLDPRGEVPSGRGAEYARFLVNEVVPFVDGVYHTSSAREHRAVAGSSLGGLISLYLAWQAADVFGKIGAMSPSIWWHDRQALRDLAALPRDLRIWLDIGSQEGDPEEWAANVENVRQLGELLEDQGFQPGDDLIYWEDEGAAHNEVAWRHRMALMLHFFYAEGGRG